jgi:hypothetical protein
MILEKKSFLLRIDADLWKSLEKWAQDELRSVNGQIEWILRDAVSKRKKYLKPQKEDSKNSVIT